MGLTQMIKASKSGLLVTPVHEVFLASTSNVELSEEVAEFVKRELTAKQRDRTQTWSSSSLGGCQRKHVLKFEGATPERGVTTDLSAIFHHGTWTHLKWQAMGYQAGWLGQTEVPCAIAEYGLTGTIDGILHPSLGEAGWELKSINERGYRYVLND